MLKLVSCIKSHSRLISSTMYSVIEYRFEFFVLCVANQQSVLEYYFESFVLFVANYLATKGTKFTKFFNHSSLIYISLSEI